MFEEVIELAKEGDYGAIRSLGDHYYNEQNYEEALKWYTLGAENSYPDCMYVAATLGSILAYASRKIGVYDDAVVCNLRALYWAEKALENGVEEAENRVLSIKESLGIDYCYCALESNDETKNIENYQKAISVLKTIYNITSNPDVWYYLAYAIVRISKVMDVSYEDLALSHLLFKRCVDEHFGDFDMNDLAAAYLGLDYTHGIGCDIDYDKAVHYYQIAHNLGVDCSEELSRFRKKLFGGYTFVE